MASGWYGPALRNVARGLIDFDTDAFKVMLVTSGYTENFDTHDFRDDITNEVTGTGYTAGGATVTATVSAYDTTNNRQEVVFAEVTWPSSTITARKAVYYKSRGGAASADEIVAINDFGSDVVSTAGTFTLPAMTLRLQN